jgi:hypothetical protein
MFTYVYLTYHISPTVDIAMSAHVKIMAYSATSSPKSIASVRTLAHSILYHITTVYLYMATDFKTVIIPVVCLSPERCGDVSLIIFPLRMSSLSHSPLVHPFLLF